MKQKHATKESWISTFFWAAIIAVIFRSFLLEPFHIPSGSMIPTLEVGDHLFVKKWSYGYSRYSFPFGSWDLFDGRFFEIDGPKQGDIIVFRKPNAKEDYVKRLIGMPNDEIQMKSGRLYINGKMVERQHVGKYVVAAIPQKLRSVGFQIVDKNTGMITIVRGNKIYENNKDVEYPYTIEYKDDSVCVNTPNACFGVLHFEKYIEILPNGIKHEIIELADDAYYDNTPLYRVPDGHYFFMGDDRDLSGDSRDIDNVGFVSRDNVLGRVWFIFYSHNYYGSLLLPWNWPSKIRWERFFMAAK